MVINYDPIRTGSAGCPPAALVQAQRVAELLRSGARSALEAGTPGRARVTGLSGTGHFYQPGTEWLWCVSEDEKPQATSILMLTILKNQQD